MINLKMLLGFKKHPDRRVALDRRVDHLQAEISDMLAETSAEDFPLLTKRGKGRRS